MSDVLGKVTSDLEVPRGPDVELRLALPADWIAEGAAIEVRVPRRLTCAACHGGGCDACARSGALALDEGEDEREPLRLTLPRRSAELGEFALRLPHQGAVRGPDVPAGHLLVIIGVADAASPLAARRIATPSQEARHAERVRLMKVSALVAVGLIATFVGLLRLSGWL